jgi:hypothetical protein
MGSQPVGQVSLATSSGHGAPPVVGLLTMPEGNTAGPLDRIWRHHNDPVFNGAQPGVEAILARVREEYSRWRLARLFHSESFGFAEPVQWIGGE